MDPYRTPGQTTPDEDEGSECADFARATGEFLIAGKTLATARVRLQAAWFKLPPGLKELTRNFLTSIW